VSAAEKCSSSDPVRYLGLALLLAAPALALHRVSRSLPFSEGWIAAAAVALSALAFTLYAVDKRRAETRRWRVPESTLHLVALAGGWPGAFLAQRQIRHKNAKASFQFVFWLIVAAYQGAAIDYVFGGPLSRALAAAGLTR
jgi:uncharacterized membrane protein YsdA (DUF1294 family)